MARMRIIGFIIDIIPIYHDGALYEYFMGCDEYLRVYRIFEMMDYDLDEKILQYRKSALYCNSIFQILAIC